MFCIYKTSSGPWVSEYIERGRMKVSARASTPIESIEKLFEMIAGDDDETGTYAEIDGEKPVLPSDCDKPSDGAK